MLNIHSVEGDAYRQATIHLISKVRKHHAF